MYCSTCGKSLPENLNYCSGCGARNEKTALVVGNSSARPFALAAMVIGGGGIFGIFPLLRLLLDNPRLDQAVVLLILAGYLLTVLIMFAILVGHIWKNSGDIRIKAKELNDGNDAYISPRSFRSVTTAQLEPAGSVTDHTTKTLEYEPIRRS